MASNHKLTGVLEGRAISGTSNANDLLTIINDLLDMSQIEAGRLSMVDEPFEIEDSVKSVVKLANVRAEAKQLVLRYTVDPALPRSIDGDAVRDENAVPPRLLRLAR